GDERILRFFERDEHRLFVGEQRLFLSQVLNLNVLPDPSRAEDRPVVLSEKPSEGLHLVHALWKGRGRGSGHAGFFMLARLSGFARVY
ncbi:MAG: hypothetical protein ACREI9_13590, partial [Nitrospiraceae bacterium]